MSAPGASSRPVRVRFAPSPTGYFHVGGARTALYNWAFARQNSGVYILRIEDTDKERNREDWVEGIYDALRWIGAEWDDGPYRQSERGPLYAQAASLLWEEGAVYACDCSRDEILARTRDNPIPGYDGFCRTRGLPRGPGRALRFAVPRQGTTVVHDVVRGDVDFANDTIEDFVVVKSNGDPLFVLANVVDDRDMGISHVIRAEEHLPTTPKAILIWETLNHLTDEVELPSFAHLSVLVNEKRQKISKRRDRVALEDYEADGYLPEAMANYLVLLGWSPPDGDEFFSMEDFVADFRLEDVTHSPAFFDNKKLLHFNGVYIRRLSLEEFTERVCAWADASGHRFGREMYSGESWERLAPLVQERVSLLSEVPFYLEFLRTESFSVDGEAYEKAIARDEESGAILRSARDAFADLARWDAGSLKEAVTAIGAARGRKLGKAQAPVRVATLGRSVGLPLFESLEVLGRDEALRRLEDMLARQD